MLLIKSKFGFTLIELLVVMAISSTLFGLITLNLSKVHNTTSQNSSIDSLLADIKLQQIKAMNGSSEGRATSDNYGIYFMSDQYVIFHGGSYNPSDSSNFIVKLPENIQIQSTTFPNNTIVFSQVSGEIAGFTAGNNTINLREINSNVSKVIYFNRFGVITNVQ